MFSFNANSTRSKTFCGGKCVFSLVQPEIFCFNAFRYLMSGHCDFFFFFQWEKMKNVAYFTFSVHVGLCSYNLVAKMQQRGLDAIFFG